MEIESESKLKKQAIHIESLSSRIDRLESDRKLLYDENTELKSQIEEMIKEHKIKFSKLELEKDQYKQKSRDFEQELFEVQKQSIDIQREHSSNINTLQSQNRDALIKLENASTEVFT